ncbi:MAG: hypothetical protein ACXAC2_20090 [Candidatus Kariarchaeaceae archaeon]|jgi:hypothetical protein
MGKWLKYLYILIGLTAAIGVVSGIGSTCTTFFDVWWRTASADGGYSFAIIGANQPMFIICYVVTWLSGLTWGVLGWALRERKTWFYNVAVINSIAGILSGIIPVWILFYEWWQSLGLHGMAFTPSWFRVIANVVLFIILILPRGKNLINNHLSEASPTGGGSMGTQVANFSLVLIGLGLLMLIQPLIMPMTHQFEADVYMYIGRQLETFVIYTGLISLTMGIILRFTGQVINYYYPKTTTVNT